MVLKDFSGIQISQDQFEKKGDATFSDFLQKEPQQAPQPPVEEIDLSTGFTGVQQPLQEEQVDLSVGFTGDAATALDNIPSATDMAADIESGLGIDESIFDVFNLQRFLPEGVQRGIAEGQRGFDVVTEATGLDVAAQKAIKFTGEQLEEIGEFFEEAAEGKFVPKEGFLERPISNIAGRTLQAIGFLASPVGGVGETLTGIAEGDVDEKAALENLQVLATEFGVGKLLQIGAKLGGRAFRKIKQLIGSRGEKLEKVAGKSKSTALELLAEKGKKVETKAFKESRVKTPRTKLGRFLFGEKIDPGDFDQQASDFIGQDIPNLSKNRAKAIDQIRNKVDDIDVDVTKRSTGINVEPSELEEIPGKFLEKTEDIASDFPASINRIKKDVERFNSIVDDLKVEVAGKGNLSNVRSARIKWDKSFDPSIRKISAEEIVGKPNSTQAKWNLWMEGRGELNESFFDIAARKGDKAMQEGLRKMSLGINSIEQIAKSGKVAPSIIKRFRGAFVGSGLTILGFAAAKLSGK